MSKRERAKNKLYACPCCGYATLFEPENYFICEICNWEDDGQDDPDHERNYGGPNHVSLKEGRRNYIIFGAAELKDIGNVREARLDDINLRNYKLEYDVVRK